MAKVQNIINQTLGIATATSLQFTPTTNGIIGVTDGSTPSSGFVGEYLFNGRTSSSPITLPTNVETIVATITLSPGDWDVVGSGGVSWATGTYSQFRAYINTSSAVPASYYITNMNIGFWNNITFASLPIVTQRWNVTTSTTLNTYILSQYTGGAPTASGFLSARRIR